MIAQEYRQHIVLILAKEMKAVTIRNAFIWGVVLLLATVTAYEILGLFYEEPSLRNEPETYGQALDLKTVIMVVIVAPILETLVAQALAISIGVRCNLPPLICVFLSAIVFSSIHFTSASFSADVLLQMMPLMVPGAIYAYVFYNALDQRSFPIAIAYTSLIHAISNAAAISPVFFYS